jgi:hypothetical protein
VRLSATPFSDPLSALTTVRSAALIGLLSSTTWIEELHAEKITGPLGQQHGAEPRYRQRRRQRPVRSLVW